MNRRSARVFNAVFAWRWLVLAVAATVLILLALSIPRLTRDSSADAFISPSHPAVAATARIEALFGYSDPIIVAIANDGPDGIFNPESLNLVRDIASRLQDIEGVDPDRVRSLATERAILGTADGFSSEPLLEAPVASQEEAEHIRSRALSMPVFTGRLVAEDGSATLIVAELLDRSYGNSVYHAARELANEATTASDRIFVAGEGAVAEHLSEYIDADAFRVYPLAVLVIMGILMVAYRSVRGTVLPLLVVGGSLIAAIGAMAASGTPYYIITTALPAILIAISVADGIHILGQYFEEIAHRPASPKRELLVRTMANMWRPVVFTSVTDAAGFAALAAASTMPPMRAFGVFACVGVLASMTLSLFVFPCLLSLLPLRISGAFRRSERTESKGAGDAFGKAMEGVGRVVIRRPRVILAMAAFLAFAGLVGGAGLEVNYQRIDYFHADEPIFLADAFMNDRFDGTTFFDIVFETPESEGLLDIDYLKRIESTQGYLESLPHVTATTSVVDYLKQMNRALNENRPEAYALPDTSEHVAQYFLLYANAGDATGLEHVIDYDYRTANIRVTMNSGLYSHIVPVLESARQYIESEATAPGLTVTLAGRANVNYYWVKELARGHFLSVAWALLVVWLMASYSFRSLWAGLFAIAPVCLSVLSIYAMMGVLGIWLEVGTSMFAAIGIGISVNFAIHTLVRVLERVRLQGNSLEDALRGIYPTTGRALLFNFSCVFLGFGILATSQVPPLNEFGVLVAVALVMSFLTSITVLPALLLVVRPRFAQESARRRLRSVE